jgi:hypothetical protein
MVSLAAPAVAALIAGCVGCAQSIRGVPRPMTSAVNVLPTDDEISVAVGNNLAAYGFKPFVGGTEIMPDGFRTDADATPIRCVGVTETMLRVTYDKSDVIDAARQSYFNLTYGVAVSGADTAATRLGSEATADALFATFARDWSSCDGQTVVKHLGGIAGVDVSAAIDDVIVDGSLLSATVVTRQGAGAPAHYQRAAARSGAFVVEVSLAVDPENRRLASSNVATRVAELMGDKVQRCC